MTGKELELYIHIPFCVRKCAYCDFLSGPSDAETIDRYVTALTEEIRAYQAIAQEYLVTTMFLGGGTPSVLTGEQMERILLALGETFSIEEDAEISMEANPGTVTTEKLAAYKAAGINRISFGLQSVNNEELKRLGRIHTYEEFLESYDMARKCGFENINVDLISAIPGQTAESWEQTLEKVISLHPEHISAYSLIIEEGTPFAKLYGEESEGEKELPGEEEERAIYQRTGELLRKAGYHRYEISNYAKEGRQCRHNLGYWERKNYLGMGLGASSLLENVRYTHTDQLEYYIENASDLALIEREREVLSIQEQMEEYMFLGLRKMEGISAKTFAQEYGKNIEDVYGKVLDDMLEKGLMIQDEDMYRLTDRGIDISNYVMSEFLLT